MSAGMAKISANVAIIFTVLTSMFWLALIFQEKGWSSKTCAWYTVETGAWKITISRGLVVKMLVPNRVVETRFFQAFTPSVRTTEDFKEFLCGLANSIPLATDMCFIGQQLHGASLGLIAACFFGTFCNCCASAMIAMWAYGRARESLRLWARILYGLTFAIYGGGLIQYAVAAAKLQDLPPNNEAVTMGTNVMLGAGNCLLSGIPLCVVVCCIGRTREEALNEHLSFRHHEQREEKRIAAFQEAHAAYAGYGAASYTTAGGTFDQPASFDQSWQQSYSQEGWPAQDPQAYMGYSQIQMPASDISAQGMPAAMPDLQQGAPATGMPQGQQMPP